MLLLIVITFYFTCFVSAQSFTVLPPFPNTTSSLTSSTSSTLSVTSTIVSETTFLTTSRASTTSITSSTSTTTTTRSSSSPSSTALSCPASNNAVYTAPSGKDFIIECGIDHARGDLTSLSVTNLEGCIAACDANPRCLDVSLSGTACYLKSVLGRSIPAPGLLGAKLLGAEMPLNCPESDGMNYTTTSTGKTFEIECGVDYAGGDLKAVYLNNDVGLWLESCMEACGNTTECVDVSLSGSACYLKKTLGRRLLDRGIFGARLL